jgi:hypothetical protein
VNLTRIDSRMKVSLKGLPDTLRGVAWPTSACVVRAFFFRKEETSEPKKAKLSGPRKIKKTSKDFSRRRKLFF